MEDSTADLLETGRKHMHHQPTDELHRRKSRVDLTFMAELTGKEQTA